MTPTRSTARRMLDVAETRKAVEGVTIAVPGSAANLGPGFDALAVGVQLYTRVTVQRVREEGDRNQIVCAFDGVPLQGDNYVASSISTIAERKGVDFPSLELIIDSEIPMQAGLGSSAAATVAGLLLYDRMTGGGLDLLVEGTAFEGHPDNIAASLLGGLASGSVCDDGRVLAVSTPWPDAVPLVAVTPLAQVKTPDARRVLPASISRADAVFNLQRVALLVQALWAGRLDLLRDAVQDRWHQPYRAALVPGLAEVLALKHDQLLGVCLSGSGPTVLALCDGETGGVEAAMASLYSRLGIPCRIRALRAHNGPPCVSRGKS